MKSIDKKQRDSNFELLRLISMLSIVLYHCIYHTIRTKLGDTPFKIDHQNEILSVFFIPFLYFGVCNFIMISGYFRIKFKISNLLNLLLQCIFYSSIIYIIMSVFVYDNFSPEMFMYSFMPMTHNMGLWFIPTYICLFLISPLLNSAIDNLSKTNFISILIIYFVFNIYFYCFRSNISFMGNISLFIFFYLTGAFIQKHIKFNNIKKLRLKAFLSFIVISAILGVISVYCYEADVDIYLKIILSYGNPVVVIISISIFLFFYTLKIKNSYINYLAVSSLAIYLIHENIYMQKYTYKFVLYLYESDYSGILIFTLILLYAIAICFCCIYIDKLRIIILSPLNKLIQYIDLDTKYDKLLNYIASITNAK